MCLGGEKDRTLPAAILPRERTRWTVFNHVFSLIFSPWYMLGEQEPECLLEPKKSNLKEKDKMVGDSFWLSPNSALITGDIL